MLSEFKIYLEEQGKSSNTISGYILDVKGYVKWFQDSFGKECAVLYRQNILEYKSYLLNIKKDNARTINHKLSSLKKLNEYLVAEEFQNDLVVNEKDMLKIQTQYASPTKVTELEVKQFMQSILEGNNSRNYALVTLLSYTGLRISEALNIRLSDFNFTSGECIIRKGKGEKQRIVLLNSKVINAIKEYLKDRPSYAKSTASQYLFVSNKNEQLNRVTVNKIFKQHSKKITPHQLRHFFCTNALEKGLSIHEVANIAGHSNIHTTLLYTNPELEKIKKKMELL